MEIEEKEIDVLDLLLVVAENLKLLVIGPVLAGLLALGVSYGLPEKFSSQAILSVPTATATATATATQTAAMTLPTATQAAAMMVSPLILDSVVQTQNLYQEKSAQAARAQLTKQIAVTISKDGLLRLQAIANTPAQAQAIANAVIDSWLKSTVPVGHDREDLEKRLAHSQASLESLRSLTPKQTSSGAVRFERPLIRSEHVTSLLALDELQTRYFSELLDIQRSLQGLSRDVIKQPPTLPTEPVSPKKDLIVALTALGSALFLLLWVFMQQSWKHAAQDPQTAAKQAKLLSAIGYKKSARST